MFSKVRALINSLRVTRSSNARTPSPVDKSNRNVKPIGESVIVNPQRTELNEEDITIVWLGKDTTITGEQSFIGSLRTSNDYIQVKLIDQRRRFVF